MVAAYIRFSTDSQDEVQQVQAIKEWAEPRGIFIDTVEKDEGVSGGVSFRDRHLNRLVKKMKEGDTLIVSEISRLGRSMGDLNKLINDELKPRKIRLVVTKMGLDLNCAKLQAVDEMMFFAFSFAAQVEKELIQSRTQSALDARKELIRKDGGFTSKRGTFITHLGNKKGCDLKQVGLLGAQEVSRKARMWRQHSTGYMFIGQELHKGTPDKEIIAEFNRRRETDPTGYSTPRGGPLTSAHLSIYKREILKDRQLSKR